MEALQRAAEARDHRREHPAAGHGEAEPLPAPGRADYLVTHFMLCHRCAHSTCISIIVWLFYPMSLGGLL